ncbi:hypothetical protein N9A63_01340 [Akkermansiaceae bacterium]|nr:hypothetical protein [Akkermansiaceae bacterium]
MNSRLLTLFFAVATLLGSRLSLAHDAVRYHYDDLGRLTYMHVAPGKYLRYYYDTDSKLVVRTIIGMTDTDNDQMDDVWEKAFFGNLSRDGSLDFDNDKQSDLAEFIAQTDPVDKNSTLKITATNTDSGPSLSITWEAVLGVKYVVESTSQLSNVPWTPVAEVTGTSTSAEYPISIGGPDRVKFFRVRVVN